MSRPNLLALARANRLAALARRSRQSEEPALLVKPRAALPANLDRAPLGPRPLPVVPRRVRAA